jgi:uncharacterized protein (TIGR02118 family)
MSRADFIHYYENHHVPLVRRLLPMIGAYTRCYVNNALLPFPAANPEYDVVTEMTFADAAALQAFWQTVAQPDVQAAISADHAAFLKAEPPHMITAEARGD